MSASVQLSEVAFPHRFRSLQTLLALAVLGSVVSSIWLMPSPLERVAVAVEQGDQARIGHELDAAAHRPVDPGEARALVDVALTLGAPDAAASILERFLAVHPSSVDGLRLLAEVQRQRHRTLEVAALDERIYAITGDPDALRESADVYASRHMVAERIGALRRLAAIGHATASDMTELTHRLADAGEGRVALGLLMTWLEAPQTTVLPAELLGLAASLSVESADAAGVAARLGALIGRNGQVGPLHIVIQTYAERGHSALSLIAGRALGDVMAARPDVALALAQLEALQGEFATARARLETLDRAGTLPPAGRPMLIELDLQAGDLTRAVQVAQSLSPDQIPPGFPHRLVEPLDAAGRADLLADLPLEVVATSSPASAAVIALARGDRVRAAMMTSAALSAGADPADLGSAFGHVVHALGREQDAVARLLALSRAGALDGGALSLLLDLANNSRIEWPALLDALRTQRDVNPRAGMVWAVLAIRHGGAVPVAAWLHAASSALPTQTLLDVMLLAVDRNEADLARAAAAMLLRRTDFPDGWTQREIALTAHAREKLTAARLRDAIDLIGDATTADAARDRVAAVIVGAPGFVQVGQDVHVIDGPAVAWLENVVRTDSASDRTLPRLDLLATLAPQRAIGLLAPRLASDRKLLLPIYLAALDRAGRGAEAKTEFRSALLELSPKQQDAVLYAVLARVPPGDALPVLRIAAITGRADWLAAYEDKLAQAGMVEELRAALRTEAASGSDPKRLQSLASRLVDLNDRSGAIAILKELAAGKPPSSPEVQQLTYLWGPRADAAAVAWTGDRALAAPLDEFPKWLENLAYLGEPGAVVSVIERRPAALSTSAGAVRAYDAALIAGHAPSKPDLRGVIAAATRPDVLAALAQLAIDTAQPASAWQAARDAVGAAPTDADALRLAAEAAAALRRSEDAVSYYTKLLALGPQPIGICIDAGDALLTAKHLAEGRALLQSALARLSSTPATLADARLRARALMLLSRDDEAAALLTTWLVRFPHHPGLRADLLQIGLDRRDITR